MVNPAQQPMGRAEVEQKIVALAWKDEAFRKAFLADPKGEFEKRLGTKLPASLRMSAHAEDENHLHFVIPAKPGNLGELSDGELEKVAGGVDVFIMTAFLGGMIAGVAGTAASAVTAIETKKTGW